MYQGSLLFKVKAIIVYQDKAMHLVHGSDDKDTSVRERELFSSAHHSVRSNDVLRPNLAPVYKEHGTAMEVAVEALQLAQAQPHQQTPNSHINMCRHLDINAPPLG